MQKRKDVVMGMDHGICGSAGEEGYGMKFIEKIEPPLPEGRVCVNAIQKVHVIAPDGKVTEDTVSASKEFYVLSRAFTMNEADVYSVSPGNAASGNFANELPHITLENKTFPWEHRTASGEPWVALLALAETEFEQKDMTIAQLLRGSDEDIYFPASAQPREYLEDDSDLCHVIDIEKTLFQKIAPRKGERSLLTHGKFLNLMQKTDETLKKDGYFATVIGNRFVPSAVSDTVKSTVHLVSMLGYEEPEALSTSCPKIRLVSLYRWSVFSKSNEEAGFTALMRGIDCDVMKIGKENELLRHGYVPKRHLFRSGENTVSLYRGPLSPYPVPKIEAFGHDKTNGMPVSADGALLFNREKAVFDVSYSTAWQIGRLLAIQNKAIASSIVKWRKNVEITVKRKCASGFLAMKTGEDYSPEGLARKAVEAFVQIRKSGKNGGLG